MAAIASSGVWPLPAVADNRPTRDIYFVAIGNEHYASGGPGSLEWQRVPAPVHSATRVAYLLRASGARHGILLTSDPRHAVTRADMLSAMVDLKKRVRADRAGNPLVVFYYMGHGLGDTFNQTLYLPPGDMVLHSMPSQTASAVLGSQSVSNLDVISSLANFRLPAALAYYDDFFPGDLLYDPFLPGDRARASARGERFKRDSEVSERSGHLPRGPIPSVPFVALFDNCYDSVVQDLIDLGRPAQPGRTPFGTLARRGAALAEKAISRNIVETLGQLQQDGLVLYAVKPGEFCGHYADPADPSNGDAVGPLARRLMLATSDRPGAPMTMRELERRISFEGPDMFGADRPSDYVVGSPRPYSLRTTSASVLDGTAVSLGGSRGSPDAIELRKGSAPLPGRGPT